MDNESFVTGGDFSFTFNGDRVKISDVDSIHYLVIPIYDLREILDKHEFLTFEEKSSVEDVR